MDTRRSVFLTVVLCLTLLGPVISGTAHAVTALDGFNPAAYDYVRSVAMQADGKILIGGTFTTAGGAPRNYFARLNTDGTLDTPFNPNVNGIVRCISAQPDGKILIGGTFTAVGAVTVNRIARLNSNGTLDTEFNPNANNSVLSITVQPDGKILLGGLFTTIGLETRNRIARLNANGSLDTVFNPDASADVNAIVLQPDGRILIGGVFTTIGVTVRNYIARLNADGSLDTTYNPDANNWINVMALQPDGKLVIAGYISKVGDITRNGVARLNPNGTLDADFDPNVYGGAVSVNALALQQDGKILIGGGFTYVGAVARNRAARLNINGTLDETFNPNPSSYVYSYTVQQDGKIIIGGSFGTIGGATRLGIARFVPDGSLDVDLNPGAGSSSGYVGSIAVQPDGKILVGGSFTMIGGVTRNNIARLKPNGSLDTAFDPNADSGVYSIAIQPDGKILVGGEFTSIGLTARSGIARLNPNGTLDTAFDPILTRLESYYSPIVYAIGIQPDGKILMGGLFNTVDGVTRNFIARLLEDGTLDSEFIANFDDYGGTINSIAVQVDGKILIGGMFTSIGGVPRIYMARLNANGTLDTGFNANLAITLQGQSQYLYSIAVQTDGKILIGGNFINVGGVTRNRIARLNAADGTLDTLFDPNVNSTVWTIALQADGRILIGGNFTTVGAPAVSRVYIARLNTNGALDTAFTDPNVNTNGYLRATAVQADGKILIGGMFTTVSGAARKFLARLTNNDAALQELSASSTSNVTWMRGQSSPEVWRTTFEFSTDGTVWTSLGIGTRISGGWQLSGLSLPVNADFFIRAKGYATGGIYGVSSSLIDSVRILYISVPVVQYTLTANAAGNGGGTVTSDIGAIGYSYPAATSGSAEIDSGDAVTLTATAANSTVAWSGDCSTNGGTATLATCSITSMDAARTVTATFTLNQYTLTANATGTGWGAVTSSIGGIGYSYPATPTDSALLNYGEAVTLTATAVNSTVAWSGGCSSTGGTPTEATCSINFMDAARTVTATFSANPATVKIDGDSTVYYSIDSALDSITTPGKIVRTRDLVFVEDVTMASSVAITLKGGYIDNSFTTRGATSRTVIDGTLKIRGGTLKVERLSIR